MRYLLIVMLIFCSVDLFAAVHTPALDDVLSRTDDNELVRVVLFLENPLNFEELYETAHGLPMQERRAYVVAELKTRFEQQGELLMETLTARKRTGISHLRPLWIGNSIVCEITPAFLQICEEQYTEIAWVMHDRRFENTLDREEEPWLPPAHLDAVSWGVADIGATRVWDEFGVRGRGALVGMNDSGIDLDHPDLVNKIWVNPGEDLNGNGVVDAEERNGVDDDCNGYVDDFHGWNFDEDNDGVDDDHGHGTSTAGIVAGGWTICDTVGVAPEAKLMVLRGYQFQSSCWLAMQYAIEKGAHVISASLSFKFTECSQYNECPDPVVWRHMNQMELAAGLVHVNSTGNEAVALGAPLSIPVPACSPPPWLSPAQTLRGGVASIIAVTGFRENGDHYSPSGRGPSAWSSEDLCFHPAMPHCHGDSWPPQFDDYPYEDGAYLGLLKPEICGPTEVKTLARGGSCRNSFGGTSAATPHVGGTVALIVSAAPGITPEEICRALKLTARDAGPAGEDSLFGAGKVDAYAAVAFVLGNLGEVTGLVTDDASGLPIEGVRVSTEYSRAVFTDADGRYHLFIPPGEETVRFYYYGYEQVSEVVDVAGGETVTVNQGISVVESGTLEGTVYRLPSEVYEGATVRIIDTPIAPLETDENGRFEAEVAAGTYQVVAAAELLEADTETVVITASQVTVQDFYLDDSRTVFPTGPDAHGYRAWDDVDSGGVAYDWVEINPAHGGPGTPLNIIEDQLTFISLPFEFKFYGETYTSIGVTENGFISMGSTGDGSYTHYPIPSTSGPGKLIAPFWVDFRASASGADYAYYFDVNNHRFIIEWDSVSFWHSSLAGHRITFEVILYDQAFYGTETGDGAILFQYKRVDFDMYCTVGIENASENDGIQYLFNTALDSNAAGVTSGRSIYFTTGDVSFSAPTTGKLPDVFYLVPCWPNPFNPTTTFEWGMPHAALVRLEIFDILGRRVALVVDENHSAGIHRATFDGSDLATGIYFARLQANGDVVQTQKLMLIK